MLLFTKNVRWRVAAGAEDSVYVTDVVTNDMTFCSSSQRPDKR